MRSRSLAKRLELLLRRRASHSFGVRRPGAALLLSNRSTDHHPSGEMRQSHFNGPDLAQPQADNTCTPLGLTKAPSGRRTPKGPHAHLECGDLAPLCCSRIEAQTTTPPVKCIRAISTALIWPSRKPTTHAHRSGSRKRRQAGALQRGHALIWSAATWRRFAALESKHRPPPLRRRALEPQQPSAQSTIPKPSIAVLACPGKPASSEKCCPRAV